MGCFILRRSDNKEGGTNKLLSTLKTFDWKCSLKGAYENGTQMKEDIEGTSSPDAVEKDRSPPRIRTIFEVLGGTARPRLRVWGERG